MHGQDVLLRYLEDAEAAERNFEDVLSSFSKRADQQGPKTAWTKMSYNARTQRERLEERIRALGGSPSIAKSALAHTLGFAPVMAQVGQDPAEKTTQELMMTIAAAAAETAMYEALASAAAAAGDTITEQLARQLQQEERQDYQQASSLLRESALEAFQKVVSDEVH